jgi:LytS/YehU family sensor histidine kinase
MEIAKRQLEEEALRTELSFLRSQINPHFLYNTLSYLYTKAYPVSEELAEGIAKLSDIMRYALKESIEQEVPLLEEIEHLHNFIALQQARFSNCLQVQFKVEGHLEEKKILPMVLISFVENAFKHGDLRQEADPLRICVAAREQQLAFVVKNRKSNGSAIPSTHIGNQNIQKRLALAYAERHQLSIWEDEQHYRCELIIHA